MKDLEAEKAILGAVLLKPSVIEIVASRIDPDSLLSTENRKVYKAMLECHRRNLPPDLTALSDMGIDPTLLSDLSGRVATTEHLNFYISIITDKASLRLMAAKFESLRQRCLSNSFLASEIASDALAAISESYKSPLVCKTERQLLEQYVAECKEAKQNRDDGVPARSFGVPTGLDVIDESLVYSGLPRGQVTIVGAQTSKGKSALSQAFKRNAAAAGNSVLVLTFEDSGGAQTRRDMSAETGITNQQLQRRIVGNSEWEKFVVGAKKIHNYGARIFYIDESPENVDQLLFVAQQQIAQYQADLVIVDYLQLVPSGKGYTKQQQHTDYVFEQIVKFARRNKNVAVLVVSQMSRHEGRPQLDRLYHSAKLEQGSHTVILIWDPKIAGFPRPRGGVHGAQAIDCRAIDIAKQKDGPVGVRVVGWDPKTVRFYKPDPHDQRAYQSALENL